LKKSSQAGATPTFCYTAQKGTQIMITYYRTVGFDDLNVFFREAGSADAPALLLFHGFPTSSHMFRELMPALADRYHVLAPDLPGFPQCAFGSKGRVLPLLARLTFSITACLTTPPAGMSLAIRCASSHAPPAGDI